MGVLALDDRDATIAYSTGWSQAGSSNEFNSTTTFSETVGARAQVTFYGSRITVYGTIAASLRNRPTSSYTLDNAAAVNFEGRTSVSVQYNQMFYQSPVLPVAAHTLTITNTGDDAPLFLDVLLVTPPDEPMVSTVTTTMTMTPPASTTARTVTVTATAQSTASGSAQADSSNSGTGATSTGGGSNGGAIAGGIIGALAFILLLAFGFIYYRRRRRQQRTDTEPYWVPPKPQSAAISTTPSPPFAPQFQSSSGGPEMNQINNSGYSSYEPWQSYSATQTSGQPYPPFTKTTTPYAAPAAGSDLAYYDTSGAYDGYVPDPSPYPPPQAAPGQNGRVRVNLND
ncbi:hypothetical protein MD484_g8369, partial [Candolleomyces efflorescens]